SRSSAGCSAARSTRRSSPSLGQATCGRCSGSPRPSTPARSTRTPWSTSRAAPPDRPPQRSRRRRRGSVRPRRRRRRARPGRSRRRHGPAGAEVVDCSRYAVVPGMVDAHAHSNENWFRGLWDNLPLEPWMLFSYPALAAPAQSGEEIYVRTLLGAVELLRSGATTVVDFLYDGEEALEPVVRAYRDVGLRALIGLGYSDRAYHETVVLDEGLVPRALIDRL